MSEKPSAETEPVVLFPGTISTRPLPVNFKQDDLNLFSHELERTISPTLLNELRDVNVSADGILFRRNKILPESFAFPANLDLWRRRSIVKFFVSNHFLRRSRKMDRDILWVTDDWSNGYFHWLTDVLSRIYVMKDRLDDLLLLLPWDYETRDFVQASLRCFNVKNVEFLRQNEVIQCGHVFIPTHTAPSGHYNEEITNEVRARLLECYGDREYRGEGERLYISRGRAPKRKIINEAAVIEVLAEFGFQTLYAEDLSFEQQVKAFSRARYLISNHGAGLTNMLFAPQGASVLELRHHTDSINNCYFTLASALKLNYFYQTCESADSKDPHAADLLVETDTLRKNLGLM